MGTVTGPNEGPHPAPEPAQLTTLVWIDSREAVIARGDDPQTVRRIESDVPAHHRATGHVRHEPQTRFGGGGRPQTAGEPHRLEHLARFLESVLGALPTHDDLVLLGPGVVHEHLERQVRDLDARRQVSRSVRSEPSARLTRRQLLARLREANGSGSRRRTVGAYRWTGEPPVGPGPGTPRRVVEKRPIEL